MHRTDLADEAGPEDLEHAIDLDKSFPESSHHNGIILGVGVVLIEGHCDERGTSEYNLALGAKRAQAAKDYLTSLGLDAQRLSTISYGQELPVCTEHNEDCWQKNRHDRFVIKSSPTS